MKYFSEVLNQKFDTLSELESAEEKYEAEVKAEKEKREALVVERKIRAEKIENMIKERQELDSNINKEIDAFCKDYGYFHCSIKSSGDLFPRPWFDNLFNHFFDF